MGSSENPSNNAQNVGTMSSTHPAISSQQPPTTTSTPSSAGQGSNEAEKKQSTTILSSTCDNYWIQVLYVCILYSLRPSHFVLAIEIPDFQEVENVHVQLRNV